MTLIGRSTYFVAITGDNSGVVVAHVVNVVYVVNG